MACADIIYKHQQTMLPCRVLAKTAVNKSELRRTVADAFMATNRQFLELAEQEEWIDGTTAVVAVGVGEDIFLKSQLCMQYI